MAAAKAAGAKYPELCAAQWALESAWGKETSGTHNYFGLKGTGMKRTTQEVVNGKVVTVEADFLNFSSVDACVKYLVGRWYKDFQSYQGVNHAPDRNAAAKELVKQGYATDPAYAEKLIKVMNDKVPAQASAVASKPILTIEAAQETWLKKKPIEASHLVESSKKQVPAGKAYAVTAYTEFPAEGHAKVELTEGAGSWFIYEPHWKKVQKGSKPSTKGINWNDFNCLVTPNLTVGEILQWDKRRIPGGNDAAKVRLLNTANQYQAIRDAWKAPLGITSFYRPEPINTQVGGVPNSRHVTGEAFDCYPIAGNLNDFYRWIRVRWTGGLGDGRNRGFIHLDTRNGGGFVPGAGRGPVAEWIY